MTIWCDDGSGQCPTCGQPCHPCFVDGDGWATLAVGKWLVVLPFAVVIVGWRRRGYLALRGRPARIGGAV